MAEQTPKISVTGITKSFGSNHVLKGVDLNIAKGESVVIIGGSGSGKSVFLKCILGLMEPDAGTVTVDGTETTHLKNRARYQQLSKFGMLFQNSALFDSMTVWENVAFGLLEQGEKRAHAKEVAIERLGQVGLKSHVADLMPADLSGGMRKRVGLARAVCLEPEIIFYDEPTTGLDPITTDVINDLILKLKEEMGITSLTITHNMPSAYKIADRIGMLYEGELIFVGTPKELKETKNEYVQQFITGSAQGPIKMKV